jgi:hypothetical protein
MNKLIYSGPTGVKATLTDSSASHYGIPVLRVEGKGCENLPDYGPADILPSGLSGAALVVQVAGDFDAETREAAQNFCAQWPEGPQI